MPPAFRFSVKIWADAQLGTPQDLCCNEQTALSYFSSDCRQPREMRRVEVTYIEEGRSIREQGVPSEPGWVLYNVTVYCVGPDDLGLGPDRKGFQSRFFAGSKSLH